MASSCSQRNGKLLHISLSQSSKSLGFLLTLTFTYTFLLPNRIFLFCTYVSGELEAGIITGSRFNPRHFDDKTPQDMVFFKCFSPQVVAEQNVPTACLAFSTLGLPCVTSLTITEKPGFPPWISEPLPIRWLWICKNNFDFQLRPSPLFHWVKSATPFIHILEFYLIQWLNSIEPWNVRFSSSFCIQNENYFMRYSLLLSPLVCVLAAVAEPGNLDRKRGAAPALVLHAPQSQRQWCAFTGAMNLLQSVYEESNYCSGTTSVLPTSLLKYALLIFLVIGWLICHAPF